MSHEELELLALAGVVVLGIGHNRYGEDALPLFVVTERGAQLVSVADKAPAPKPGQTVIGLARVPAAPAAPPAGAPAPTGVAK